MSTPRTNLNTCRATCLGPSECTCCYVAEIQSDSSATDENVGLLYELNQPPRDPPSRPPFASSPVVPAATRPPAIPVFDGLESDLPDISGLSLWFEDGDSAGDTRSSSLGQSQAALDYGCHHDDSNDSGDISQDASFASGATNSADVSSDMSFGPFTPSTSDSRIRLRDCGGASRTRRWLPRGIGLGILGLDFDPSFQSTLADTSPSKGIQQHNLMLDHAIVVDDSGGSRGYPGLDSPTTSFNFNEPPFSSGHTLTSIPECDSWNELGEALRSSGRGPEGFDSANTSFSYSDFNDCSGRDEEDTSYDLDLSFSFPSQTTPFDPESERPDSIRRNRSKTFLSPTISSDLKRASSLGSKSSSSPRGGTSPALPSPTLPPVPGFEDSSFETPSTVSIPYRSRSATYLTPPAGDVGLGVFERSVVEGGTLQQAVASVLPHTATGHPKSSHKRWRM